MTAVVLEHSSTDHEELQEKLHRVRGQVWGGYATLPQSVPKQSAPAKVVIRLRTQQPFVQDQAKPFDDDDTSTFAKAFLLAGSDAVEFSEVTVSRVVRDSIDSLQRSTEAFAKMADVRSELIRASLQAFTSTSQITIVTGSLQRLLDRSRGAEWTDEKNERRCELIDKDIEGTILPFEKRELDELQRQMLAFRRKLAPLPLREAQRLHQELLKKAADR
ncbi:MAG: hypothetical protein ACYC3X_01160 [Pirellulaceae bacterium]